MKLNFFDYTFITAFICSVLVTTNTLYHISNPYIHEMNLFVAKIIEEELFAMIIAFVLAWLFLFAVYLCLRIDKELSPCFAKVFSLLSFSLIIFVLFHDLCVVYIFT